MVKYRSLSNEELKELELEFKQFLISNGIYDFEWKKLNSEFPEKATELVDLFSDVVLEKALSKITYLKFESGSTLDVFYFENETAYLIALTSKSDKINFKKQNWILEVPENYLNITYFKTQKNIQNRNKEIFELLKKGCEIVDETYYQLIVELTKIS